MIFKLNMFWLHITIVTENAELPSGSAIFKKISDGDLNAKATDKRKLFFALLYRNDKF